MLDIYYSLYPLTFDGVQPANLSTKILPNTNLKPTRTRSFETGTNLKFFNGRLNFDAHAITRRTRETRSTLYLHRFLPALPKQIIIAGLIRQQRRRGCCWAVRLYEKGFLLEFTLNFAVM